VVRGVRRQLEYSGAAGVCYQLHGDVATSVYTPRTLLLRLSHDVLPLLYNQLRCVTPDRALIFFSPVPCPCPHPDLLFRFL
jgi:hypothetical protein